MSVLLVNIYTCVLQDHKREREGGERRDKKDERERRTREEGIEGGGTGGGEKNEQR